MPAYNAEPYITEAINSIINQTFKDWELIIIDDASTDNTAQVAAKLAATDPRIHLYHNQTNLHICKTLNRGITLAQGELIARMDADDWCYPKRLEWQQSFMQKHPGVVVVGGALELCNEQLEPYGLREYSLDDATIRQSLFRHSPFVHAATMYRREIALKTGGYNPSLFDAEDYDFFFRMGNYGKFSNLPQTLYRYRINRHSVSQRRARRQEFLTIYIRAKAFIEYGYIPTRADKIYSFMQLISFFIIPQKLKIWLYQKLRDKPVLKDE